MTLLILALIAQIANPPYIRADADIEQRTVAVEYVYDGDTFKGVDGISYRLAGINAPEIAHPEHNKPTGEPGGEESSDALKQMILGERVTVLIDRAHSIDRYGRTVAIVMQGEKDVNIEMVRNGFAEIRYVDLSPMIDEPAFRNAAATIEIEGARRAAPREDVTVAGHVLAPGDRIRIVVSNQTQDFTINPDGEILIRGLGVFHVADKTEASATTTLDATIRAKGITATPITVFYLAPPAKIQAHAVIANVQVYGPVQHPGTQQAFTVVDAVRQSAPDSRADIAHVIIDRRGEDSTTVNARDIALGHDPDTDLREGDRILIPRLAPTTGTTDTPQTVTVIGDVKTPGQFAPGTLTHVLASAGGVTNTSRTSSIRVRLPDGRAQTFDLTRITSGKQDNPALPPNSTVYVESDEPRRQSMNDLRTWIGIFSSIALLALRMGG